MMFCDARHSAKQLQNVYGVLSALPVTKRKNWKWILRLDTQTDEIPRSLPLGGKISPQYENAFSGEAPSGAGRTTDQHEINLRSSVSGILSARAKVSQQHSEENQ